MKTDTRLIEYEGLTLSSIEWSAVFAGTLVALGIQVVFLMLGSMLGIGPNPRPTLGFAGISTLAGFWLALTGFVGYVCGGCLSARLCGSPVRGDGRLHGAVTWALGTLGTIVFLAFTAPTIAVILSSFFNEPPVIGSVLSRVIEAARPWALLHLLFGLIGSAIGGHLGVPRLVIEEPADVRRAA